LLAIVWIGHERPARGPELAAMEEVLERLDLLEDLELIHDLDRLAARGEG
jgi:hypothetical protein